MGKRILDQHIAIFGESGSGKTVLLSSFYGLMRQQEMFEKTRLDVVADDQGQGDRLMQSYLSMSKEGRVPPANRFTTLPYSFTANFDHTGASNKSGKYDALRFIWHDYPGEWFQETPSTEEELLERAETFRTLLASDVAIVMVDGERLAAAAGDEERYLKLLFTNIRNGLLPVVEQIEGGKGLKRFPRIWMFALSKADLLPAMTANDFRDLVVLKAAYEVDQLRRSLQRVVYGEDAIAVGEDFVLLSSAKFSREAIDVDQRIGVDLVMPIASMLPVERFVRWVQQKHFAVGVVRTLLGGASTVAVVIGVVVGFAARFVKADGRIAAIAQFIAQAVSREQIEALTKLVDDKLVNVVEDATAQGDYLRAALAQFRIDLEAGEQQGVLLRSKR